MGDACAERAGSVLMRAANVLGALLLALTFGSVVGLTVWATDWRTALVGWTLSLALTVAICLGT